MRSEGRYVVAVGGYLALLFGGVVLLVWMLPLPGFVATKTLIVLIVAALLWQLWRQTRRTNIAVARFVSALDQGDLTQTFQQIGQGSGFDELGAALDKTLGRLRQERADDASNNRFAAALVDESPTPLLAIDPGGIVRPANKRARRLFGGADGRRAAQFDRFGEAFSTALAAIAPGERRVIRVKADGVNERATIACAGFDRGSERWRIVSFQIIQSELDAAEMAAQSALVRVLTHEIMNSITPVTSLAATAAALIAEVDRDDDTRMTDARTAVEALAKRARGITHFVDSYREFSTTPSVSTTRFAAGPWLDELARLFAAMPQAAGVALETKIEPASLMITADIDLLAQVLLNLLKNGAEAAAGVTSIPRLTATISRTEQARARVVIADNGPGVPDKFSDDIFLPFFTTKRSGTGVGLSFARQVVLLHRGSIELGRSPDGGASIEIII